MRAPVLIIGVEHVVGVAVADVHEHATKCLRLRQRTVHVVVCRATLRLLSVGSEVQLLDGPCGKTKPHRQSAGGFACIHARFRRWRACGASPRTADRGKPLVASTCARRGTPGGAPRRVSGVLFLNSQSVRRRRRSSEGWSGTPRGRGCRAHGQAQAAPPDPWRCSRTTTPPTGRGSRRRAG